MRLFSPPYLFLTLILVFGSSIFSLSFHAQTLPPEINTFPPSVYEAHNQIFCVQSFPDGRIAFGTGEEVLVHDGESFRHVPVGAGKAVFSMDRSPEGRLFVGGQSLMGVIEPDSSGSLSYRSFLPMLPDSLRDFGIVWSTVRTQEGEVYFDAYEHVFLYEDDSLQVIRPENEFFLMHRPGSRPIVKDDSLGLFRLRGSKKEYLEGSRELIRGKSVHAILPSPEEDHAWTVFTKGKGLFHYDPAKGEIKPFPDEADYVPEGGWAAVGLYTACRLDSKSNPYGAAFAVGTERQGLYLLTAEGRIAFHLGKEEGIPSDLIWNLFPSKGGDLWVATNNGIALLHIGLPFTLTPEGRSFKGGVVDISRYSDPDSSLYLATIQGTWKWKGTASKFELVEGTEGQCWDLLSLQGEYDGAGQIHENNPVSSRLLVAGAHQGLLSIELPFGKVASAQNVGSVFSKRIRSLATLPIRNRGKGQPPVLVGGRDGLYVISLPPLNAEGLEELLAVNEVPEEVFMVGAERSDEGSDSISLWASMRSKGVLKVKVDTGFTGHRITHYDTSDGLPKGPIRIFSERQGEGVVFGTDRGLYSFKKGRFVPSCRYGELFCDSSRHAYRFEKGISGEVWINDKKGGHLKHLIPKGEGFKVDSTRFRGVDLGTIRAIFPEKDRVWLGGPKGLACYHPEVKDDHHRDWDCLVRKVVGSGDSLLFGGNVPKGKKGTLNRTELPYSKNRLEFHYAAPFTDKQEEVTYSCRLVGFDTGWSQWSDRTRKEYTNIPEGNYIFKVKAKNVYGIESKVAEYRFHILPPWYRTWFAYGGYMVAGAGFIWLLLWLNSRRLVAQKERLERTVEERTKEIQEEKAKVEKKNQALEEANETISKQKEEVEQQKEKVEEAHQEITQSIDYARKIQYALLQTEEHVSPHLPDHFILFKPQSQVSGDFYWAREHQGYLYIAAVDCTGHGVPGAFMSMLGISQLNEIMGTDELPTPGEILTELRDRVVRELSGSASGETAKDGMDAAMMKIPLSNPRSQIPDPKTIEFAGAQNPIYVVRNGIAEDDPLVGNDHDRSVQDRIKPFKKSSDGIEIKGDAMPVGYDEYASGDFTTVSLKVQKGDMLYIFSDGYADQFGGPKGKKFRYGPFKQLLADLHEKPMEEQKQALDRTFEDWKSESEQEQIDDVVVVGVRV